MDKKGSEARIKNWEMGGKKGSKPKDVTKNVFFCKRRKPQPLTDKAVIYRDPHKKKLVQVTTDCNDGFISGHCPFAILFNLGNVDDKPIPPEFLSKKPKISWESERRVLKWNG